ncbi:hypothetical protein PVAP13_3NG182748 [Panicum virgatum]|uniref:Uncharacterized protein n=1 Tax=Panicum virgatum TaxID=38727 RepID=A0A8T0U3Y8_PANVG|nr:hypothetical protein PVAP13_3NG182748 [Panicum virgatum]
MTGARAAERVGGAAAEGEEEKGGARELGARGGGGGGERSRVSPIIGHSTAVHVRGPARDTASGACGGARAAPHRSAAPSARAHARAWRALGASPLLVVAYWRWVAGGRPALVGGGCRAWPVPPGRDGDPARSGTPATVGDASGPSFPHVPLPVPAERAGARAGHRASMG